MIFKQEVWCLMLLLLILLKMLIFLWWKKTFEKVKLDDWTALRIKIITYLLNIAWGRYYFMMSSNSTTFKHMFVVVGPRLDYGTYRTWSGIGRELGAIKIISCGWVSYQRSQQLTLLLFFQASPLVVYDNSQCTCDDPSTSPLFL